MFRVGMVKQFESHIPPHVFFRSSTEKLQKRHQSWKCIFSIFFEWIAYTHCFKQPQSPTWNGKWNGQYLVCRINIRCNPIYFYLVLIHFNLSELNLMMIVIKGKKPCWELFVCMNWSDSKWFHLNAYSVYR